MNNKLAHRDYDGQKAHSKTRRIKFLFTFDEWVTWWENNLGPNWQQKRGRKKQIENFMG